MDHGRFADGPVLQRWTGPLGDAVQVLRCGGMHRGGYLAEWLTRLLYEVGMATFADLAPDDDSAAVRSDQGYRLVVHPSDLTRRALVRLRGCDRTG